MKLLLAAIVVSLAIAGAATDGWSQTRANELMPGEKTAGIVIDPGARSIATLRLANGNIVEATAVPVSITQTVEADQERKGRFSDAQDDVDRCCCRRCDPCWRRGMDCHNHARASSGSIGGDQSVTNNVECKEPAC